MKNSIRSKVIFLGLVVTVSLCQCGGPNVDNLFLDSGFTWESLKGSSVVVGGVTSALGNEEIDTLTDAWSNLLREQLVEKVPGVNVVPIDYAVSTLGEDRHKAMLDAFNTTGSVGDEDLAQLDSSLNNVRSYLVMSRLETDNKSKRSGENKDSTGVVKNIYYLSERKVLASFKVWDIFSRKQVWGGNLSAKATATNSYDQEPPEPEEDGGVLGFVLDEILGLGEDEVAEEHVYPATPTFTWVARTVFGKFAKALPHD